MSNAPAHPGCAAALDASRRAAARRPAFLRRLWRRLLELRFRLWQRQRYRGLALERVDDLEILVLEEVFNPAMFRTGPFVAAAVRAEAVTLEPGADVLELGTGTGIGALAAAPHAGRLTAVDINPQAVRCARINTLMHEHDERIEVLEGDLFAPVAGRRFDLVLFHPPFWRGEPRRHHDHALVSPDIAERFASGLGEHLNDGGRALLLLSTNGDEAGFLGALAEAGFHCELCASRDLINEVLTAYRVRPGG